MKNISNNNLSNLLIIWLFLFGWPLIICADSYSYSEQHFFNNDFNNEVLSASKVYTVFQDSNDFVWFGTGVGIDRFDGKSVEKITEKQGIAPLGVKTIFQDNDGLIWFGHLNGGLTIYNGKDFFQAHIDSIDIGGDITGIYKTNPTTLWITTQSNGALKIDYPITDYQHINVKQYHGAHGLSDQVYNSYVDNKGQLFCITDIGLKYLDKDKDTFVNYEPAGHRFFHFSITSILNDSKGNYWLGTYNGGLYKYDTQKDTLVIYDVRDGLASNWISALYEDSKGKIWVGTFERGLTVINNGKLSNFDNSNGLVASRIHDISEDREGNILIASHENGAPVYIGDLITTFHNTELLPDNNISAITIDGEGYTWLGSERGLVRFKQNDLSEYQFINSSTNSISFIENLKTDKAGNVWIIANNRSSVYRFNIESDKLEYDPRLSSVLKNSGTINQIAPDGDHIWIGTQSGLLKWNPNTYEYKGYSQSKGLAGNNISSIYVQDSLNVYVGTIEKSGLAKYNAIADSFQLLLNSDQTIQPECMVTDTHNKLWVGTSSGLFTIKNNKIIDSYDVSNDLLSNKINLLNIDQFGNIYIGTNNGLNVFLDKEERMLKYTKNEGFTGIETRPNASIVNVDNKVWFGTANGINIINPLGLSDMTISPNIHIKRFIAGGDTLNLDKNVTLRYDKNDIQFEYHAISIKNSDGIQYKVMLDGASKTWSQPSKQTIQNYLLLPPGEYVFQVAVKTRNTEWTIGKETFTFTINPPFYKTWWFALLAIMFLTGSAITYIKIRERNFKAENLRLEKKVQVRTAELQTKNIEIAEKNKDIMASMRYAERIQKALLPDDDLSLDTFMMYQPKDYVSGDFYWKYKDDSKNYIAAVDCTGHGVPGALMSIIGHEALNKIIRTNKVQEPAEILNQLNAEIVESLRTSRTEEIQDGMDLALIVYDEVKKVVSYCGAMNPLWLVRNNELIEFKANRFSIGSFSYALGSKFEQVDLDVFPGDMFYIFSDGYADQFGGEKGVKFKKSQFRKLVLENSSLDLEHQKENFITVFNDWKDDEEQVDDVLVMGLKI